MSSLDCMVALALQIYMYSLSFMILPMHEIVGIRSLTLSDGYPWILLVHSVLRTQKIVVALAQQPFYLSHARDKTKNISFSILYRAQNLQSLISYSKYNLKLTIFLI